MARPCRSSPPRARPRTRRGLISSSPRRHGRRLLAQALAEFDIELKKVPAETLQSALTEFGLEDAAALYEKVGLGERLPPPGGRRPLAGGHGGTRTRRA